MRFTQLAIPSVLLVEPEKRIDQRGFLARVFCRDELRDRGIEFNVAQCNNTMTQRRGTVRGMHFQRPPKAEYKMIRCIRGAIVDVAVDLRKHSPTYGQYCAEQLSASNRSMILIPPGFAHGFQTLEDDTELIYWHSEAYSPKDEGGVCPRDAELAIRWPLPISDLSERDEQLPLLTHTVPIQP